VIPVELEGRVISYLPHAHMADRYSTHYISQTSHSGRHAALWAEALEQDFRILCESDHADHVKHRQAVHSRSEPLDGGVAVMRPL
jgi:hypothetical protein